MAIKSFSFKVDFITKNSLCMAHVKQNDNAIFNIYLTQQGQALDLTGQQIRLFVRKPDGKLVVQETGITVVDAKGGAIRINVQNSIFQAVGVAVCEIDLWGNDNKNASSGSFLINIDEQLGSNDVVKSYVDVNLFRQLTEYIDEANAEILKYKTLFEAFVKAGVSLQGLNDIKAYIDNNLAELKFETDEAVDLIPKVNKARTDAEAKRVEVVNATNSAEAKRVQVVDATSKAEAKRIEVVNVTATADNSKNTLIKATTNADNKKTELEGATASAEAKRKEVVSVTNTANTSKSQLEIATANADKKKDEVVSVTANAEKKRAEVVGTTNTANEIKKSLDGSIASGNSVKAGLDGSINTGNNLKAGLDASIKSGNDIKTALDSATSSANTKKVEVETATNNAEQKRIQVVAVTDSAEAKRKELDRLITQINAEGIMVKGNIPASRDCNDFKDFNRWIAWDTGAGDFKNTPEGTLAKGTARVFVITNRGYSPQRIQQEFINVYPQNRVTRFVRNYNEAGWGAWYKVYDEANKPTPSEIGAVNKAGDTITGYLKLNGFENSASYVRLAGGSGNWLGAGTGATDVYICNDKSQKYLQLKNDGRLCYADNEVYHQGRKPTPSEIGALGKTEKAVDSDKLHGMTTYDGKNGSGIPVVATDGVMEVGKFLDFHAGGTGDYDVRLEAKAGELNVWGNFSSNDLWARKYLHVADWYNPSSGNAQFWYKNENRTLYLENAQELMINNSRVHHDPQASPLWSGGWYVTDTQYVYPTKKLSQCNNGWVLVWSDFDPDTNKQNDTNWVCTYIHKNCWHSGETDVLIPINAFDAPIVKALQFQDHCFNGYGSNSTGEKADVILRFVYEW